MKKIFLSSILLLVTLFLSPHSVLAGSEHNLSGFAWSSNVGWISFNSTNDHDAVAAGVQPSPINYGVDIGADGYLSGYAWSPNIGWIKFGGFSGFPAGSGTVATNARLVGSNVSGWAKALSASDGWDGWISFSGTGYGVVSSGSGLSGYAWGSDVVGWVQMDVAYDSVVDVAPTVSLSSSPSNVTLGQPSTLTWEASGAASCSASTASAGAGSWSGARSASGGSASVTPTTLGAKTYTVTCLGSTGLSSAASATVTAQAGPVVAPTVSLSASPLSIALGEASTITWSDISSADSCQASPSMAGWTGSKSILGGSTVVNAAGTYGIICSNSTASTSASVTISQTVAGICPNGATNYPDCTVACLNGATNPPECTLACSNGAVDYPACTVVEPPGVCDNGATNYPVCTFSCSNGATNYPECTVSCLNGATNPPECTVVNPPNTCSNGATNYPECTIACLNGSANPPICTTDAPPSVCINGATNPMACTIGGGGGSCTNGATNYPTCTFSGGSCTNGATNYPACTVSCLNGASNPMACDTFAPMMSFTGGSEDIKVPFFGTASADSETRTVSLISSNFTGNVSLSVVGISPALNPASTTISYSFDNGVMSASPNVSVNLSNGGASIPFKIRLSSKIGDLCTVTGVPVGCKEYSVTLRATDSNGIVPSQTKVYRIKQTQFAPSFQEF